MKFEKAYLEVKSIAVSDVITSSQCDLYGNCPTYNCLGYIEGGDIFD